MFDEKLLFEHSLRDHVRRVREKVTNACADVIGGEYTGSVHITYDGDDGGRWCISHYYNRVDTIARGAELDVVFDAWLSALRANHANNTLRSLLIDESAQ